MTESDVFVVKRAVRSRDGHRCVDCGLTDAEHRKKYRHGIEVHRNEPGSEYSLNGCVTVCRGCHGIRHRGDHSPRSLSLKYRSNPKDRKPNGRNCRPYPLYIADDVDAGLEKFRAKQSFPPSINAAINHLLREILTEQGCIQKPKARANQPPD